MVVASTHTVPLPAVAFIAGSALTVTVMGTLTEEQPVLLLVTTRLKSYTPAAILEGMVMGTGETGKVALVIVEKPAIALTPAVSVYWFGLPVAE